MIRVRSERSEKFFQVIIILLLHLLFSLGLLLFAGLELSDLGLNLRNFNLQLLPLFLLLLEFPF